MLDKTIYALNIKNIIGVVIEKQGTFLCQSLHYRIYFESVSLCHSSTVFRVNFLTSLIVKTNLP